MASAELPAQLSVVLPTYGERVESWDPLIELAVAADRAGVDRVVVSEHVVFGENLEAYADPSLGGQRNGRQPTGPDGPWLDPLVTLSYLAGVTTRVRLGTAVLLAALRRPVVLAKTAATLDVLSHGRLDLGVGVGWQREEYEAAGLPFEQRGGLLDHTLEVCQALWTQRAATYDGHGLEFAKIHQAPKPVRNTGVPIWISGTTNRRAMDRLARFGSGWIPWGDDAADIRTGIERMRTALADRGRASDRIEVMSRLPALRSSASDTAALRDLFAPVAELHGYGVTDFRVGLSVPSEPAAAQEYLTEAVGAFRSALS